MRISTETIYDQQTAAIDNLVAQQALYGQQLSTGLAVNQPSDDPSQIAQLMSVQTDIGVQTQVGQDLTNLSSELTTVDGSLSNVTSIMQQARSLAIQGASDTNTPTQLQEIGIQVGQLLQESVGLANTQYAGRYVFAGTATPSTQPVTLNNTGAATIVNFSGNIDEPTMQLPNGQTVTAGVTLQQAFNYDSSDGSPSVFQVLQNLYNTLTSPTVNDTSSVQINTPGASIVNTTALSQLVTGGYAATPLLNGGNVSITISTGSDPNGTTIAFNSTDTMQGVINKINAQTAVTGVTASFDQKSEKITLSGGGPFEVADVGGGNFVETFGLQTQASKVNDLSRQLGDIDHATQALLDSRAVVGSTIQQVTTLSNTSATQLNNDTTVQSNIQDTNVAKATSQFQLAQTALQAAYATTTKIEQKDLFDYVT